MPNIPNDAKIKHPKSNFRHCLSDIDVFCTINIPINVKMTNKIIRQRGFINRFSYQLILYVINLKNKTNIISQRIASIALYPVGASESSSLLVC